jgi:flagellin-like protein
MNYQEREEAVSPVIGVILMVAITVILAAVIAVFVFGMAGDVQSTKVVAVSAKQVGANVTVTYQGGPDHNSVNDIKFTIYDTDGAVADITAIGTSVSVDGNEVATFASTAVGAVGSVEAGATSGQERIVVTADFTDGTTQVIYDNYL